MCIYSKLSRLEYYESNKSFFLDSVTIYYNLHTNHTYVAVKGAKGIHKLKERESPCWYNFKVQFS